MKFVYLALVGFASEYFGGTAAMIGDANYSSRSSMTTTMDGGDGGLVDSAREVPSLTELRSGLDRLKGKRILSKNDL